MQWGFDALRVLAHCYLAIVLRLASQSWNELRHEYNNKPRVLIFGVPGFYILDI